MRLNLQELALVLAKAADGKSEKDISAMMQEAVALLAERGELGRWRELEAALHKAWEKAYGASRVTVVSAHALTDTAKAEIEKRAAGADVTEIVDNRLIGGAVIRIDNTRIDGSVTGALMRLKHAMYSEV